MWVCNFLLVLFSCEIASSQTLLMPSGHSSAQGQLTVTATVVCSARVVWDEKGTPQIVLANCPDPADNVSELKMVVLQDSQKRQQKSKAHHLKAALYKSRIKRVRTDVHFQSNRGAAEGSLPARPPNARFTRGKQSIKRTVPLQSRYRK